MNDKQNMDPERGERGTMIRRRRLLLGIALAAVTVSGTGLAAATAIKSPAELAARTRPPAPDVLTAPVTRQTLSQTVVLRGAVTSGQSVDVAPMGATGAKPVVTKVPLKVGDQIKAGQAFLEVSGRPVFAFPGELPVYRDLKPGARGEDVKQLKQALRHVGFDPGGSSAVFDADTSRAVDSFYAKLGYDPVPALPDGAAQVAAAQDAVNTGEQALADARDALKSGQQAPAAPASPSPSASTSTSGGKGGDGDGGRPPANARKQVDHATKNLEGLKKKLADVQALTGPMVPASEVVYLSSFPARVDAVTGKVGDGVSGKVMTVSAGNLAARGNLTPSDKGLVRAGQKVEILSELTGRTAVGTVTGVADAVEAAAQQGAAEGRPAPGAGTAGGGYAVIATPDEPLDPKLAGQQVRLTITAGGSSGPVLSVPASAVSATADGRTVVTVYAEGQRRQVEVTTGVVGGGSVEIRPADPAAVKDGDQVIVGVKGPVR
ncbi:peptidoglycan-binding protein [Streptomyces virginiae]|uniref:peptidoglycan-binding protein n=1 Tax=Streptomyces virginiae TaxID=1961 RepID=UPI0022526166|nr:peptidoglycan-binding protein [Streptomyces virginiae]MCX5177122.1 peptidoglycan-binding protein [Streptomyces virginiae]